LSGRASLIADCGGGGIWYGQQCSCWVLLLRHSSVIWSTLALGMHTFSNGCMCATAGRLAMGCLPFPSSRARHSGSVPDLPDLDLPVLSPMGIRGVHGNMCSANAGTLPKRLLKFICFCAYVVGGDGVDSNTDFTTAPDILQHSCYSLSGLQYWWTLRHLGAGLVRGALQQCSVMCAGSVSRTDRK
jgi:hypothetical protein